VCNAIDSTVGGNRQLNAAFYRMAITLFALKIGMCCR
jgi:hypothetical protein